MVDTLFFLFPLPPFLLTLTLSRWPLSYLFLSSFSQSCPKLAPSIPRFQLFRSNFCSAAGPTYHSANIFLVFCIYVFLYFCIFVFLYFCIFAFNYSDLISAQLPAQPTTQPIQTVFQPMGIYHWNWESEKHGNLL